MKLGSIRILIPWLILGALLSDCIGICLVGFFSDQGVL